MAASFSSNTSPSPGIRESHIESARVGQAYRLIRVARLRQLVAAPLEEEGEGEPERRLVVRHKHPQGARCGGGGVADLQ